MKIQTLINILLFICKCFLWKKRLRAEFYCFFMNVMVSVAELDLEGKIESDSNNTQPDVPLNYFVMRESEK